ncbi:MAG: 23S rRNA (adenine(2503)-C(2))-methyltransferase RlmN, partial [Kordiimonadaceae bacterium]|nr:23S rRNA (adenine(2503)-C(2))-methyltransferase RlmN [Kordiimonadaceae bacterium]
MQITPSGQPPIVQPRAATDLIDGKVNLLGLSRDELKDALREFGVPEKQLRMRTGQLWHCVYHRGATDFAEMTTISKDMRAKLEKHFIVKRPEIVEAQYSEDGTRKYLIRFADGNEAEAVYIPEEDRGTLCISSQVGCTLNCKFCHTGTMNLVRNLTAAEIVAQMMIARDDLDEWQDPTKGRQVTNIVMMGMGEPLYNFDNV